jgi:endonuclease/exonuclease/phosphatase family metal-dependent hydrolase
MIRPLVLLLIAVNFLIGGQFVKIASYNVENLFDLHYDGTEYLEYIPETPWKWNRDNYQKKLSNIAKVIIDLNPDIIALQEVENLVALKDLRKELKRQGSYFEHFAITSKKTTVKTAVLSKIPIVYAKDLRVKSHRAYRSILEVKFKAGDETFYLFNNHWKAKSGPESKRHIYAKALRQRLETLGHDTPVVMLGDFNSHYEEHVVFEKLRKHNDTSGITGINHILKTLCEESPTTLKQLSAKGSDCYYNLWYDLDVQERWSHIFRNKKEALDHLIISHGMQDGQGIEYQAGSFQPFKPAYLFKGRYLYRWQKSTKHPKHHLGKGYSDHLPISATFIVK